MSRKKISSRLNSKDDTGQTSLKSPAKSELTAVNEEQAKRLAKDLKNLARLVETDPSKLTQEELENYSVINKLISSAVDALGLELAGTKAEEPTVKALQNQKDEVEKTKKIWEELLYSVSGMRFDRRQEIERTLGNVPWDAIFHAVEATNFLENTLNDWSCKIIYFRSATLNDVLDAFIFDKEIEGKEIGKLIREERVTFITVDDPMLSAKTSLAILKHTKKVSTQLPNPELPGLGRLQRAKNADEFVKEIKPIIDKLKKEHTVSTFRDTVDMLNNQGIQTYLGKKWHIKTLQELYKRAERLGI